MGGSDPEQPARLLSAEMRKGGGQQPQFPDALVIMQEFDNAVSRPATPGQVFVQHGKTRWYACPSAPCHAGGTPHTGILKQRIYLQVETEKSIDTVNIYSLFLACNRHIQN